MIAGMRALLLSLTPPLLAALLCPAPFNPEAGRCVFVNSSQSFSWCDANRLCASLGGELMNSYGSLQLMRSMPSLNCGCRLWLGLTDLADERDKNKTGWQMINGRGILPLDASLWSAAGAPSGGGGQDCQFQPSGSYGKIDDNWCANSRGLVCEWTPDVHSKPPASSIWKRAAFARTSYHSYYCYSEVRLPDELRCVAAASSSAWVRHALFNSKLGLCRLLEFTDAQVEAAIENSNDWAKFIRF